MIILDYSIPAFTSLPLVSVQPIIVPPVSEFTGAYTSPVRRMGWSLSALKSFNISLRSVSTVSVLPSLKVSVMAIRCAVPGIIPGTHTAPTSFPSNRTKGNGTIAATPVTSPVRKSMDAATPNNRA